MGSSNWNSWQYIKHYYSNSSKLEEANNSAIKEMARGLDGNQWVNHLHSKQHGSVGKAAKKQRNGSVDREWG